MSTNRFSRLFKRDASQDDASFLSEGTNADGGYADANMSMDGNGSVMQDDAQYAMQPGNDNFAGSAMTPLGGSNAAESADLVRVPLLGSRTVGAHQRILGTILVLALIVLAVVTFLALAQAGRVAREVAATGDSATQSQQIGRAHV